MNKISGKQIGIIVLTIATALIHLVLAFIFPPMMVLFILNVVGYLALLAGYFLPQFARFHNTIRWLADRLFGSHYRGLFCSQRVEDGPARAAHESHRGCLDHPVVDGWSPIV